MRLLRLFYHLKKLEQLLLQYNIIYVKRYLASLDGKYKSFPDKYLSFLDHILQTTGTIFTYQPYSMAFSFEYDSAIPVYAFSIPVDAIDTPVFKTGAYNVRADPAPAPKDHFSDEDISALFPFPKYAEPQPAQPIVAYTTYKEKKGKNGKTEKSYPPHFCTTLSSGKSLAVHSCYVRL